jgi:ubiquinone/menaquinone biosynthesis C-methylase UbiE
LQDPSKFWNKIAQRYAAEPIVDTPAYTYKLTKTQEYLRPHMKLLELGCGTGSTALRHAPNVHSVLATDFSTKMIDIAREKAKAAHLLNISFKVATVDDITAPDHGFDIVLALSLFHLLEDKSAAFKTIFRLLKPGGLLISSTECIGDFNPILRAILPIARALGLMPYVGIFRTDELIDLFEQSGFQIEHTWQPGPKGALFVVAKKPLT